MRKMHSVFHMNLLKPYVDKREVLRENPKGTMAALPWELVEEILLKLPYSSLITARCVCKAWKAAADSSSVISRYTDSGNFFAAGNCIADSSGKMLRWAPAPSRGDYPDVLCAVSPDEDQRWLARSTQQRKLYLGNPFHNVWQEIPYKRFGDWSRARILGKKIVVWCADGSLFTWTQGDEDWSSFVSPLAEEEEYSEYSGEFGVVSKPVVIGTKLICKFLHTSNLFVFDTTSNSFSCAANVLPRVENGDEINLAAAWKSKLYVVMVNYNDGQPKVQILELEWERLVLSVVSEYVIDFDANDGVGFVGQAGKYLNFCGEDCDLMKTETTYFCYDMDAGTWDKQMHRAASAPVHIGLC